MSDQRAMLGEPPQLQVTDTTKWTDYCHDNPEPPPTADCGSKYQPRQSLNEKVRVRQFCSITQLEVDAIVCSTSTNLSAAPIGVSRAVRNYAGLEMIWDLEQIGHCQAGAAIKTPGFNLPANYVLHTAGPAPNDHCSAHKRRKILRECIMACLSIVSSEQHIRSVAFPCIGTGGWGLNTQEAAAVTMETVREWLENSENREDVGDIIFCFYDDTQWKAYLLEMYRVFPPVTDNQDVPEVDTLPRVESGQLRYPRDCSTGTSIFCFRFSQDFEDLHKCFHKVVQWCRHNIASRGPSLQVEDLQLFCDCAILHIVKLSKSPGKDVFYRLVLYHNQIQNDIQVKLYRFGSDCKEPSSKLCFCVRDLITLYLSKNLDVQTNYQTFIKCPRSQFGSVDSGMSVERIRTYCLRKAAQKSPCGDHGTNGNDLHFTTLADYLKCWFRVPVPVDKGGGITEKMLMTVARKLGSQHTAVGIRLGIRSAVIERIQLDHGTALLQAFHILKEYQTMPGASLKTLFTEMRDLGLDTEELETGPQLCQRPEQEQA